MEQTKKGLLLARADLKKTMRDLELSDDSLFTNRNGNLPAYRYAQSQIDLIDKELERIKEDETK